MFRKDENDRIYFDKPKMFKKLDKYDDGMDIALKILSGVLVLLLSIIVIGVSIAVLVSLFGGIGWWIIPTIISLPFVAYGCYWVGHKILD